jgi:hypothetical protein
LYSWDDENTDWAKPGAYAFKAESASARAADAAKASASGPRTYEKKRQPDVQATDPKKRIVSRSTNPLIIAVDVTGSMGHWPFEIFDRLPLLYMTLSQYRSDLEISFAAIGDAACDRFPLQTTDFARGFDLETRLKALYGEGGGGDEPESYGLFAWWVANHVETPEARMPFLIVFGDATMHLKVPTGQIKHFLGDEVAKDEDSLATWQQVSSRFNTWFLRRPTGTDGDSCWKQWADAVGAQKVVMMDDEQRAVDYAMGLIARSWGHFDDFKLNMKARQDESKIEALEKRLVKVPVALSCPKCSAPIPPTARGLFACSYCGMTLSLGSG